MQNRGISQAVIRRLPRYYRYLGELIEHTNMKKIPKKMYALDTEKTSAKRW